MRRLIPIVAALVLGALVLAGCGSSSSSKSSSGKAPAAANMIVIKSFAFAPKNLTVKPGATVTVKNEDSATHTVTGSGKAFDTGDIASGKSKTFTAPAKAGSYTYICSIHQYMQGTLTVS
jgi:plastocyanin